MLTSLSTWFTHPMWWFFVASALFAGLMKLLNLIPALEKHMEEYSVTDSERAKRLVDRSYKTYRRLTRPDRQARTSVAEALERHPQKLGWQGIDLENYKGPVPACPDILKPLYGGLEAKIGKKVFEFVPFSELEEDLPSLVRNHKLVLGSVFPTLLHLAKKQELRIVGKFMTPRTHPAWMIGLSDTISEWESSSDRTKELTIGVYGRLMSTTVFLLDHLSKRKFNWRLVADNTQTEIRGFDERSKSKNRVTVEVLYELKVMMALLKRAAHDLTLIPYPLTLTKDVIAPYEQGEFSAAREGIDWGLFADYPLNVAVTEMKFLNGSNGNNINRMLEYVLSVNSEIRKQRVADAIIDKLRNSPDRTQDKARINDLFDGGMFSSLHFVEDPRIVDVDRFANKLEKLWEYGTRVELLPSLKLKGQLSESILAGSELPCSGSR